MSNILSKFVQHQDHVCGITFVKQELKENLAIKYYRFCSQVWPISSYESIPSNTWMHNLVLYLPTNPQSNTALLYVNGGYNKDKDNQESFTIPIENLNFSAIALHNKIPVIDLQNVPNQYLTINGVSKKEDQILAFTYKLFLQTQGDDLPGHLPMAKAIIKAMDAVEDIINVDSFILVGASKRGWAAWLAAIEDSRVSAIIPLVIDILNVQKSIIHICSIYQDGCPMALKDYKAEGLTEIFATKDFANLMKIEDPYQYIEDGYDPKYRQQFSKLAKYIINAAGDDFFAPDCSQFYFKSLPGDVNHIRYLPNSMHYLKGNFIADAMGNMLKVSEAISNYVYFHTNNIALPQITYNFAENWINVNSSAHPITATLWSYNNPEERDFRLLSSYSKLHFATKYLTSFFTDQLCDRCYVEQNIPVDCNKDTFCQINITLPGFIKGWQASFVELTYSLDQHNFVITTEVNIAGKLHSSNIPHDEV